MIKNLALALLTLGFLAPTAFANPEADNLNEKPRAQNEQKPSAKNILLVRTAKDGTKTFFQVSKKVSPVDVPAAIEQFAKTGKSDANIVKVKETALSTKNPKNPEAEGDVEEQSWFYYYNNYRYGCNPGASYYYGYWPQTYYYNQWAPNYRWSYGYYNYTWGIYW
jgi:hypothetical protein